MKKLWVLAIAVVALAGMAVVAIAKVDSQTLDATVTPAKKSPSKKKLRGVALRVHTVASNADGTKPTPATSAKVTFPKYFRFDTAQFPTCSVSKLEADGVDACEKAKVGEGTAVADAGLPGLRAVQATVTAFNGKRAGGKPTIILYSVLQTAPLTGQAVPLLGVLAKSGSTSRLDVTIPGLAVPGVGNAAITDFDVTIEKSITKRVKRNGKRRKVKFNYVNASHKCGASGWVFKSVFTYEDGSTKSANDTVACS